MNKLDIMKKIQMVDVVSQYEKYATEINKRVLGVIKSLLNAASRHQEAIIPGYTHLQRAQPIHFAHWCLAYVEMLKRDLSRLDDLKVRMNQCPLGSGALAGTTFPVDRHAIAEELGFDSPCLNSLDAVSDRDFVLELLFVASTSMMHLSRLAEDMILGRTVCTRCFRLLPRMWPVSHA